MHRTKEFDQQRYAEPVQYANVPHGNDGTSALTTSVVIMRSLTSANFTAYETGSAVSAAVSTDNEGWLIPSPTQFKMLGGSNTAAYNVYYTGAGCTGTPNVRFTYGAEAPATQISAGSLMLLGIPNLWLLDQTGTLEVKLTVGATTHGHGTSASYWWHNGAVGAVAACVAQAVAALDFQAVTTRTPAFPAGLGFDWYIDQ